MKFRWQLLKFRWQRFGIPVSNFPAFYEHNGERSNPGGGLLPIMAYTGGPQTGVSFSGIRSMKG